MSASPAPRARVVGVDAARALASLIMVQGHAYHAWVAEPHRDSPPYLFTRLLGTLPLPAFLLLAGVGVGLRARAAVRRGEAATQVRSGLAYRGFQVLLAGYATNVGFALLDGAESLATLLRADVLHAIGLSIVTVALLGVRADARGQLQLGTLRAAALVLWLVPSLACPWLSPLGAHVPTFLAPLVAPFVDVPTLSRMPLIPLVAWLAIGVLLGTSSVLLPLGHTSSFEQRAGTSRMRTLGLLVASVGVAWAAHAGTEALVAASGAPLTRAHPAVALNVVDFAARGVVVLALGLLLGGVLPAGAGRFVARLGQSSLWIYVFHLPFCYGRPGKALWHALDMTGASLWLVPLMAASVAVGWLRSRLRAPRQPSANPVATG